MSMILRRVRLWLLRRIYLCYVASIFVACVLCADDAALISPTVHGMHCLIDICSSYDAEQDIEIKNCFTRFS